MITNFITMTKPTKTEEENNAVASLLLLLSPCGVAKARIEHAKYGCKTCGRRFASFQALGGHCTTHKRARPAERLGTARPMQPRVHGCTVCGMEFSMGQALGGHMRRHKPSSPRKGCGEEKAIWLDLNSPPPEDRPEAQAPLLIFLD